MISSDSQQHDFDNREFVRLLAEHERQLSGYVHTLVPQWQDAEDVLQNCKLRLWEQFATFRRDADFGAWAIAIANYMVLTHRKKHQRQRVVFCDKTLEKLAQYLPAGSSPEQNDRAAALAECVAALNDISRRMLRLFCSGHQKIKDIAHEMGQTPAAAYTSMFRIRRNLFDCVEQRLQKDKTK
jgi:RNA polymerase sigma-70 factor, ECF subfamily